MLVLIAFHHYLTLVQTFEQVYKITIYPIQCKFSLLIILGFAKECKILCFLWASCHISGSCLFLPWLYSVLCFSQLGKQSQYNYRANPLAFPLLVYSQVFRIFTYSRSVESNFDSQNYSRFASFLQYLTAVCVSLT